MRTALIYRQCAPAAATPRRHRPPLGAAVAPPRRADQAARRADPGAICAPLTAICGVDLLFATDAQLAAYAGAAPLEVSSAERTRHRLNRGGDRQRNAILYRIAVTQARCSPQACASLERRTGEGKTRREAVRRSETLPRPSDLAHVGGMSRRTSGAAARSRDPCGLTPSRATRLCQRGGGGGGGGLGAPPPPRGGRVSWVGGGWAVPSAPPPRARNMRWMLNKEASGVRCRFRLNLGSSVGLVSRGRPAQGPLSAA